jgi:predicted ABC-type ATPase
MPYLTIIAGCNGAGKSTFAPSFLPESLASFDYDKLFLEYYNNLPDSEFREKIAKNKATETFEQVLKKTLRNKTDFCYETNFDAYPVYWVEKFRENGFTVNLIFFCLESQEIARHRIQVRTEFKGHFVDNTTIDLKWKAGYKNLNAYYAYFDNILVVDNSKPNDVYTNILQLEKGKLTLMADPIPVYIKHRLPDIFKLINK